MRYKLTSNKADEAIWLINDANGFTVSFLPVSGNQYYEEYLAWLAAGNTPEPPDPPIFTDPKATIEERLEALELIVNQELGET